MSRLVERWRRSLTGAGRRLQPDEAALRKPPEEPTHPIFARFDERARSVSPARVLEIGTLQARPGYSTHAQARFPGVARADYVMADVQGGPDVDVVADLHALPADWSGRFGAVVATAVFEHLERPWIAAREVARVLAPGGFFFVSTHQTFPLHGFPQDFFRFSKEALALIFADAGLQVDEVAYSERSRIVPPGTILPAAQLDRWNEEFPSWVLVSALGRKPG